jgi:hypothetical protein
MEEVDNFITVFDKIIQEKDSFNTAPKVSGALSILNLATDRLLNCKGEFEVDHEKLVKYNKFLVEDVIGRKCTNNVRKAISNSLLPGKLAKCRSLVELTENLEKKTKHQSVYGLKLFEYCQYHISPHAWLDFGELEGWYNGVFKKDNGNLSEIPFRDRLLSNTYVALSSTYFALLDKFYKLLWYKLNTCSKMEKTERADAMNLVKIQSILSQNLRTASFLLNTEFTTEVIKSKFPGMIQVGNNDILDLYNVDAAGEEYIYFNK